MTNDYAFKSYCVTMFLNHYTLSLSLKTSILQKIISDHPELKLKIFQLDHFAYKLFSEKFDTNFKVSEF